jgi:hypothetical protein
MWVTMILATILSLMVSWNMAATTSMKCISNVSIVLQARSMSLQNVTFTSCACFIIQQNDSSFQYNENNSTCLVFNNITLVLAIQNTTGSRVCFTANITLVRHIILMS